MSMSTSRGNRRGGPASGSRIHQGLVGARLLVGTSYLADPALRSEYERDIAPRTKAALTKVLAEIFPRPEARERPRRFLDLGSGTGAAGMAMRAHFGDELDLLEVDRIATSAGVRIADITDVAKLAELPFIRARFDLVVSTHVLNELYVGEAPSTRQERLARVVKSWCEILLGDGGTLILVEPALRETSRTLLAIRDRLLGAGLHVVAPCFFTGPCPALLRERDWCHDSAPRWPAHEGPPDHGERQSPPNRRGSGSSGSAERVDFSYLVVRASGEPTTDPTLFRIVSDPLPEKGRLKVFACGSSGRHAIVRLDRHATTANAGFDQLARGDVARVARTTFALDGLRVVKDTSVERQTE
jgi:ribosomal protein RSM22 (predicted rRNA methylase)